MKKILVLLALVSLCASASAKSPQTISTEQIVSEEIDGVWHMWSDEKKKKPLDGTFIIVGDGYRLQADFVKGVLDGTYIGYDSEERVREISEYRSGLLASRSQYHENGVLSLESTYRDGLMHGDYTEYHENGSIKCSSVNVDGVPDGTIREWDEQGRLVAETQVRMGAAHGESVQYIYDTENPIKTVETYDNGEIYGDRLGYYIVDSSAETLAYRYRYDDEELLSAEVFDIDGLLISMQEYVGGKPSVWTYYSQGVLTGRMEYDEDMVGHLVYYHLNGKIWKKGLFIDGQMTDEIEYDQDGNIIRQPE